MVISGKDIATSIYDQLINRVGELKKKGINPHLAVILVGNNPSSLSYIRQKNIAAERIGAKLSLIHLPGETTNEELLKIIRQLNNDTTIHAILVQKPLPPYINVKNIDIAIAAKKDVDGFNPKSKYTLALPLAVVKILTFCHSRESGNPDFRSWLKSKSIVILGKGATAGHPTIVYLEKLGIKPVIIDSKTVNKEEIIKKADIIISAVGKPDIIKPTGIKQGVILIGVGMHSIGEHKLRGDYNEDEIKDIASFYTPTPGGVGPVNVACLMENFIKATER